MALFSLTDEPGTAGAGKPPIASGSVPQFLGTSGDARPLAKSMVKTASLVWLSEGNLHLHQVLEALLNETGPADVWLTAYAITEEPARRIFRLRQANTIRRLICLVDKRLAQNNAKAYQLLSQTADAIGTAHIHAKAFVVANESFQVTVLGSANFSNNPRLELGYSSNESELTMWMKEWINERVDGKATE